MVPYAMEEGHRPRDHTLSARHLDTSWEPLWFVRSLIPGLGGKVSCLGTLKENSLFWEFGGSWSPISFTLMTITSWLGKSSRFMECTLIIK
jgi:hypothetical protein